MKNHQFTIVQQAAYDAIMEGYPFPIIWPKASGKTYLYNAILEDLKEIRCALDKTFSDEVESATIRLIPWYMMPISLRALPFDQRRQALRDYETARGETYDWEAALTQEWETYANKNKD